MSWREELFLRKLRHPPEERPRYGHFEIIKTIKQNIIKQIGTQQLETEPGCEQTQEESISTGAESVVANGSALARERKTKTTLPGE
ncbi:hypothetical protein TNCV_3564561 [Trichonephila clavipes]|nr:hypothetical protein TNCV_3564561 [Trichonephila clavipes]